jgi:hypothetical protein
MKVDELLVPLEIAKQLQSVGYDGNLFFGYYENDQLTLSFLNPTAKVVGAPLYQQVFHWLRDKHNITIRVDVWAAQFEDDWYFMLVHNGELQTWYFEPDVGYIQNYNDAIKAAIKLIEKTVE